MKYALCLRFTDKGKLYGVEMHSMKVLEQVQPNAQDTETVKYFTGLTYEQAVDLYRILVSDQQRAVVRATLWQQKDERDAVMRAPLRDNIPTLTPNQLPGCYPDE